MRVFKEGDGGAEAADAAADDGDAEGFGGGGCRCHVGWGIRVVVGMVKVGKCCQLNAGMDM